MLFSVCNSETNVAHFSWYSAWYFPGMYYCIYVKYIYQENTRRCTRKSVPRCIHTRNLSQPFKVIFASLCYRFPGMRWRSVFDILPRIHVMAILKNCASLKSQNQRKSLTRKWFLTLNDFSRIRLDNSRLIVFQKLRFYSKFTQTIMISWIMILIPIVDLVHYQTEF